VTTNSDSTQAHTFFQLDVTRTSVDPTTMKASETTATLLVADLGDAGGGAMERAATTTVFNSPGGSHAALRSAVTHLLKNHKWTSSKKGGGGGGGGGDQVFGRSQLTQILRSSLSEETKTTLIVALPPTDVDQETTDHTLSFAKQIGKLRTFPRKQVDGRRIGIESLQSHLSDLRKDLAATSSKDTETYEKIQNQISTTEDLLSMWRSDFNERMESERKRLESALSVVTRSTSSERRADTPHLSNISNDPMVRKL
jgi:hypothetical protein